MKMETDKQILKLLAKLLKSPKKLCFYKSQDYFFVQSITI